MPGSPARAGRFLALCRFAAVTLVNTHLHADHVGNNHLLSEVAAEAKLHLIDPAGACHGDTVEGMRSEARLAGRE